MLLCGFVIGVILIMEYFGMDKSKQSEEDKEEK